MTNNILIIDNYDSFVYNIARYFVQLGAVCRVVRNDKITVEKVKAYNPSHIVISPGPGKPEDAGCCLTLIESLYTKVPLLGICLGHQAIGQVFGAGIKQALAPMHGKPSHITHEQTGMFKGLKQPFVVGRYHSLIVDEKNLSQDCQVTARSEEGEVMALAHRRYPVYGVQFHPESVLTEGGYALLNNFLETKSGGDHEKL